MYVLYIPDGFVWCWDTYIHTYIYINIRSFATSRLTSRRSWSAIALSMEWWNCPRNSSMTYPLSNALLLAVVLFRFLCRLFCFFYYYRIYFPLLFSLQTVLLTWRLEFKIIKFWHSIYLLTLFVSSNNKQLELTVSARRMFYNANVMLNGAEFYFKFFFF